MYLNRSNPDATMDAEIRAQIKESELRACDIEQEKAQAWRRHHIKELENILGSLSSESGDPVEEGEGLTLAMNLIIFHARGARDKTEVIEMIERERRNLKR